jgi:hypothetical protein
MKSKDQVIEDSLVSFDKVRSHPGVYHWVSEKDALTAMQEYSDQQTAELRREVEELRKIREAYQALTGELNKRAGII